MDSQVLLLFAFSVQLNPATNMRAVVSDKCQKQTVQNFNTKIREIIHKSTYKPNGYIQQLIGGARPQAAVLAELGPAPQVSNKLLEFVCFEDQYWAKSPVEIDEGMYVGVCVGGGGGCVCVCQ
jgi:hypothetical protein